MKPRWLIEPVIDADRPALLGIWEKSVRATHHFLPESYLQEIKALLPALFTDADILVIRQPKTPPAGFGSVDGKKIEMLFIDPDWMGKGLGSMMMEHFIQQLGATEVEVNEQNIQARRFYEKFGFAVKNRKPLDGLGRPFPILEMALS